MPDLHRLLARQVKRYIGATAPPLPAWEEFLVAVSQAYADYDADRLMLERSLELSSSELLHANSEMRAIFQALPDLYFRLNEENVIVDFNASNREDLFVSPQGLIGRKFDEILPLDAPRRFKETLLQAKTQNALKTFEFSHTGTAGERFYEVRLVPLQSKQVIVKIRNITENVRAKKESENFLSLLRATLDATTDAIFVVDQSGHMVHHNQNFIRMWGVPAELMSAQEGRLEDFLFSQLKDARPIKAKIKELGAQPEAQSFDLLELCDGKLFECYSLPQRIAGRCVGRVWSFRDVTSRHQAEEALRRSQETLRMSEKLSAVGQLAAGVAHEINNPLGVILGFADAAKRRIDNENPLFIPLQSIHREALRCKNLVQDLLTFSRQSAPRMDALDLKDTVESTFSMISAQAKVKSVEIIKELRPTDPVRGDRNQIQQVLINLCNNAIDAMPHGGRIILRTDSRLAEGRRHSVLEVEDTGSGIPAEIRAKIFDPFFTTKEVGKGTGLGLALVHEIVTRHQGAIAVRSEPGQGSVFTVTLPT